VVGPGPSVIGGYGVHSPNTPIPGPLGDAVSGLNTWLVTGSAATVLQLGAAGRSGRQGRSLAGCKSPHRQLPVFGRLAYPMRGEATNRVLLGRKSPGCPAGVFAAVGTIWGASKLGGRNITKYLQPRKSPAARSRFKRHSCGKPTHFPLGKADGTVEETGASTRCTAGVGDPASKNRLLDITSGSCRGQQGLVTTCKDSPNEAKSRRRREPNGSGA